MSKYEVGKIEGTVWKDGRWEDIWIGTSHGQGGHGYESWCIRSDINGDN